MSIRLEHVSKLYGKQHVVRDVSLTVNSGELFVLLGASGSGKSTLLRLIAGLLPTDSGAIYLHNQDVTHLPPQQRETGFVFQQYSLFRHMTVAENIAFGLDVRHVSRKEQSKQVQELLELIGLDGFGNRMPAQLSGGQQQRVALARALAYQPRVLLLDEPFGALDVQIRSQLRQNLRAIQQRLGVTTVLVTHDQEEAFELADRIGILSNGTLLEANTPNELYHAPKTRYTATFLGQANLIPAQRNGTHLYLGDYRLPAPAHTEHLANQPVELLCRPEELELTHTLEEQRGEVVGQGIVTSIAQAGPAVRVGVTLNNQINETPLNILLPPSRQRELALQPGQCVWVRVNAYHVLGTQTPL
jgi:sulfate/thiosulfate transport system ATP-binding protein